MGVAKFTWGGLLILASFWIKDWIYFNAVKNDIMFFCFSLILCITAAVCGMMLVADSLLNRPIKSNTKLSAREVAKLYDSDYKERKFF